MSSLIKPSTGGGGAQTQNSSVSVPTSHNKPNPMHQPPQSYGQPTTNHHSMVSIGNSNPTAAHNHPPSSNRYMNNPNTFSGNAQNPPSSNHPITSTNSTQPSIQQLPPTNHGGAKNMTFQSGCVPNLGHPPNQNAQQQQESQPNGTTEDKLQKNHVVEAKPAPQTPPKNVEKPMNENQEKQATPPKTTAATTSGGSPVKSEVQKTPTTSPSVAGGATSLTAQNAAVVQNSSPSTEKEKGEKTEECNNSEVEMKDEGQDEDDDDEDNEMDIETETNNSEIKENKEIEKTPTKQPPQQTQSTPPQRVAAARKPKIKNDNEESPKKNESKPSTSQKSPSARSKRARIRTQHYQSPLPELEIISKISAFSHQKQRQTQNKNDDKLTVFFKNEFLAVRNSEGSFYVCQTVQNIYRSSSKIKIRWLSQDKNDKSGEIYTPDFYDHTEFDCILTNLNLEKIEKGKFRLPPAEKERTDSILKRSLAAEKGEEISSPSVTEEHPDGLDLSLYKDETQLNKRKGTKRKAASPMRKKKSSGRVATTKSPENPKVAKTTPKSSKKSGKTAKSTTATPSSSSTKKAGNSRTERAKRRNDSGSVKVISTSPKVDQKKARALAKIGRKSAVASTSKTNTAAIAPKKLKNASNSDEKSGVKSGKKSKIVSAKVTKKKATKKSSKK